MYLLFTAGADRIFSFCSALADLCLAKSNPNILHFVLLCSMALLRHTRALPSLIPRNDVTPRHCERKGWDVGWREAIPSLALVLTIHCGIASSRNDLCNGFRLIGVPRNDGNTLN